MQISDLDSLLPGLDPSRFVFGESARGESFLFERSAHPLVDPWYHHKKRYAMVTALSRISLFFNLEIHKRLARSSQKVMSKKVGVFLNCCFYNVFLWWRKYHQYIDRRLCVLTVQT